MERHENLTTQDLLPGERTTHESDLDRTAGEPDTIPEQDVAPDFPETGTTGTEAAGTADTPGTLGAPATTPGSATDGEPNQPLFAADEVNGYRDNWQAIQTAFVDDPQRAVREADELVAQVIQSLAATFASHKSELEGQWSRGGEVATEDLRQALRQYRSFFNQLLST